MDILPVLSAILAQPTAPFREDAVRAEIERLLAPCAHVTVERDSFGNVIAEYRRGSRTPAFALAAHMDHPAYVQGRFLGGVPERYRKTGTTREFGDFAMWDLPACEIAGDRVYSRACDDLVGCAAIVAAFLEMERNQQEGACLALFTRGEEVGFVGAIKLAKSGRIPRDVCIVSLETSSELGGPGRMGEGVIVRVGDRTSIFDSAATATLLDFAAAAKIPAQRCLMAGGTCEATAYQLYGYRAAGMCVALGNYHNCGPDGKIAPEYVSLADANSMARLCVAIAGAGEVGDPHAMLRERLEEEMAEWEEFW